MLKGETYNFPDTCFSDGNPFTPLLGTHDGVEMKEMSAK